MRLGGQLSLRAFVRNLAANWVGVAVDFIVTFALTPFVIGRLGLAAYGVWGVFNSVIGYLGLVDLGVRGSLGRFVNYHLARQEAAEAREVVVTTLALLSIMAAIALVASVALGAAFGTLFPKTPAELAADAMLLLPLMALGLWLSFVSAVLRTVVAAFDRFDLLNLIGIGAHLLRAAGTVLALNAGYGLPGLVLVNLFVSAIVTLATYALAHWVWRDLRIRPHDVRWSRFREIWRFGLVSFSARMASTLAEQTGPIIAMSVMGPAAVGVYTVATTLVQNCQKIIEQVASTLFPTIMKLGGTGDMAAMRSVFIFYARLMLVLGGLLYLGVIVFAEPFLLLWLGPQLLEAAPVAGILAAAGLCGTFASTSGLTLFSLGRLRALFVISVLHALAIVGVSVLLTAGFGLGLIGLAFGVLIPSIAFHVIVSPVVAGRAIELELGPYYLSTFIRLGGIALLAVSGFEAIKTVAGVASWIQLLTAISLATVCFAMIAMPVALGRAGLGQLAAALSAHVKAR